MPHLASGQEAYRDIRTYWVNEGQFGPLNDARVSHVTDFLVENWLTRPDTYGMHPREAKYVAKAAYDSAREELDNRT